MRVGEKNYSWTQPVCDACYVAIELRQPGECSSALLRSSHRM
jgi:hypothetical protein